MLIKISWKRYASNDQPLDISKQGITQRVWLVLQEVE